MSPRDVQVIELHDCFSTNELLTYEGLGLCAEGKFYIISSSPDWWRKLSLSFNQIVSESQAVYKKSCLAKTSLLAVHFMVLSQEKYDVQELFYNQL